MKSHKWNRKRVLEMVLITICATSEVKQQRERDTANVDDKSTQHAFLCTWFGFSKMQQLKRRSSPKKLMNNDAGPDSYLHFSYRETEYRVMQCCCNHSKPLATALQSVLYYKCSITLVLPFRARCLYRNEQHKTKCECEMC